MMHPSPTAFPSAADEAFHRKAEFRALVSEHGSVIRAAEVRLQHNRPALEVAREAMQDLGEQRFVFIDGLLEEWFGGDDNARETAETVLKAQRLGIATQRRRPLSALVARDDVLLEEIRTNEAELVRDDLDPARRTELERETAIARLARLDLSAYARLLLEQKSIRDQLSRRSVAELDTETLARALEAARDHGLTLQMTPTLLVPLRRALAVELALEEPAAPALQPEAPPAQSVHAAAPRR
ncbi:MAG TPA: hypothetical protein VF178_12275 [Gemmatimonadaceae bacterium]